MRRILLVIGYNSIVFNNVANAQVVMLVFLFGEHVASEEFLIGFTWKIERQI